MKNLRIYFSFNELSQSSLTDFKYKLKSYNSSLIFFKQNINYNIHYKLRSLLFGKVYYLESSIINLDDLDNLLIFVNEFLNLNKYVYLMICVYKDVICHVDHLISYLKKTQTTPFSYHKFYALSVGYINYQIVFSLLKKYILLSFTNFVFVYMYYLKNYKLY